MNCVNCSGHGHCPYCHGSGRFGYPGFGPTTNYPTSCGYCFGTGVCQSCKGRGQPAGSAGPR